MPLVGRGAPMVDVLSEMPTPRDACLGFVLGINAQQSEPVVR